METGLEYTLHQQANINNKNNNVWYYQDNYQGPVVQS